MALHLGLYLAIWALVGFVLVVAPIWLLVAGLQRVRAKRGGRISIAISAIWLLFSAFAIDSYFFPGPWNVKILDQGTAPTAVRMSSCKLPVANHAKSASTSAAKAWAGCSIMWTTKFSPGVSEGMSSFPLTPPRRGFFAEMRSIKQSPFVRR